MKTNVKSKESARVPSAPVRALRSRTGLRHRKSPTRLLKALRILDERSLPVIYGPGGRRQIATPVEVCAPSQTRDSIKNTLHLLADVEVISSDWHAPVMDEPFLAAEPKLRAPPGLDRRVRCDTSGAARARFAAVDAAQRGVDAAHCRLAGTWMPADGAVHAQTKHHCEITDTKW
jgi:hypothetical protein